MDLTSSHFGSDDMDRLLHFIRQRKLSYQPFRFDEEHEVGEGMAFLAGTSDQSHKGVVRWARPPHDIADLLVREADFDNFRKSNDALRAIYNHFVDTLCRHLGGDITALDFAEFGCNTGYFPLSLSMRGARRTFGMDFTFNQDIFNFFNGKLGTNSTFLFSEWDSLRHESRYHAVPEVDVCLSVAVLCHLADPLHHLTYLCSRARKAVFLWTPSHASDELFISFGNPSRFPNSLAWPLGFDNLVKPSRALLELCLRESGFRDIHHMTPIATQFDEINFWDHHTGIVALRTDNPGTIYTGGKRMRDLPPDVRQGVWTRARALAATGLAALKPSVRNS